MAKTGELRPSPTTPNVSTCPTLSVLTNNGYGGVMASYAALGDLILAEPAAMIGFAGPHAVIKGHDPCGIAARISNRRISRGPRSH